MHTGAAHDCDLIEEMAANRNPRTRKSIAPVAALLLLSLLWALGSLWSELMPQFATDRTSKQESGLEALTLFVVSVVAAAVALARGSRWPRGTAAGTSLATGLGLFVAPAALIYLSGNRVPDLTRVAVFSLVPVFTAVIEPHIVAERSHLRSNSGLTAALIAVAGTLCIFPIEVPWTFESGCAFGATMLATACVAAGNCWGVSAATEESVAPFTALACAASAVGLAGMSILTERYVWKWEVIGPEFVRAAAVELPGLALLFWLMPRMTATRMSTRFLIAPLIANLAGLLLLRTWISARGGLGLFLIAAGASWLLFGKEDGPEVNSISGS